jgi:hypothetical protein
MVARFLQIQGLCCILKYSSWSEAPVTSTVLNGCKGKSQGLSYPEANFIIRMVSELTQYLAKPAWKRQ